MNRAQILFALAGVIVSVAACGAAEDAGHSRTNDPNRIMRVDEPMVEAPERANDMPGKGKGSDAHPGKPGKGG